MKIMTEMHIMRWNCICWLLFDGVIGEDLLYDMNPEYLLSTTLRESIGQPARLYEALLYLSVLKLGCGLGCAADSIDVAS